MTADPSTSTAYSADRSGLVCGFRFDRAGVPQALDTDSALQSLQEMDLQEGFLWLHFSLAHAGAEKWIADHLPLPPAFTEALHDPSRSTRVELDDGALVAVHAGESVVPASELAAARAQIAQLQRMLGKKTMEAEILKEAVDFAREKKWIARAPLLPKDDQ